MTGWSPNPYTYNSTAIDGSGSYTGYFVIPDKYKQQEPSNLEVLRHYAPPVFVDKQLAAMDFELHIVMANTFTDGIAALSALFDTRDRTPRTFVVKNASDSNKQYYRMCTPNKIRVELPEFIVELHAPDPVWKSVTQNSDSWGITATGQTHAIAIAGNVYTQPILEITQTTGKTTGNGFSYRAYCIAYNPTSNAFPNYDLEVTGGLNTAALVADTTVSNQINNGAGVDAAVTTWPVDTAVGGGLPAGGGMAYCGTEQIIYTANSGSSVTGITRGANGTTAATHADNAVVYFSRVQADGDDLRVLLDGAETSRWLSGMNGASTKVHIVTNLAPKIEFSLDAAINDSVTTLSATRATYASIKKLPTSGTGYIDTEAVTWTGNTGAGLTGLKRGALGTTAASHSAGATLRWIEHNIQVCYGNSALTAPTTDDTNKPINDLASTNVSWVYGTNMATLSGKRAGEWVGSMVKSAAKAADRTSDVYTKAITVTSISDVDPATAMGMHLASFRSGTGWKPENGTCQWQFYHPAGFTSITPVGGTYRDTGVTWPTAKIQASNSGRKWTDILTVSSPSTGLQAWSPGATALGATYNYIRFYFSGPIAPGAGANLTGNEADWQVTSVTLALASGNVPLLAYVTGTVTSQLQATITNTDTSESITINYPIDITKTLQIDCENKTVKDLTNNTNIFSALSWSSVRQHWLDLGSGTANLRWDDTGTVALNLVTKWRDNQV